MMPEFVLIQWTTDNLEEARGISKSLLEKKLIACASIIPLTESLYIWENQIESSQEIKIVMKTRFEHYPKVESFIKKMHSYELPEILATPILEGSKEYLNYMTDVTNV